MVATMSQRLIDGSTRSSKRKRRGSENE